MTSKINVNNSAVDAVWRNLIGGGYDAQKTGYYGDNQITVKEPNGRMVYSVKVVGVTVKENQTILVVPTPRNYDILAVVLLSGEVATLDGKLAPLEVRYLDEREINVSGYCWPKYTGRLYHDSCAVHDLHNILNAKLGQIAKDIAKNPPKTLPGRVARVQNVLGDPLALVQNTITFG